MDKRAVLSALGQCGLLDPNIALAVSAGADDVVRRILWQRRVCVQAMRAAGIPFHPAIGERPSDERVQALADLNMAARGLEPRPIAWAEYPWAVDTVDLEPEWERPLWGVSFPFGVTDMGLPGRIARYAAAGPEWAPLVELASCGVWAYGPPLGGSVFVVHDPRDMEYAPPGQPLKTEG